MYLSRSCCVSSSASVAKICSWRYVHPHIRDFMLVWLCDYMCATSRFSRAKQPSEAFLRATDARVEGALPRGHLESKQHRNIEIRRNSSKFDKSRWSKLEKSPTSVGCIAFCLIFRRNLRRCMLHHITEEVGYPLVHWCFFSCFFSACGSFSGTAQRNWRGTSKRSCSEALWLPQHWRWCQWDKLEWFQCLTTFNHSRFISFSERNC